MKKNNGRKGAIHLRVYADLTVIQTPDDRTKEILKEILTQAQYELHLKCKEAVKLVNWKTVIEELPVEEWRRKVARH